MQNGDYTFIHYGFGSDDLTPQLSFLNDAGDDFISFNPQHKQFTLTFDTTNRFCTGWHDLESAKSFPCPNSSTTTAQYEQCRACQQKTGFNPAFYHASEISPQQQARNQQPHILYLAHFAPGVVKVGISWAGRGIRRLLEQGARSAIILNTFPDATQARMVEASTARLPGVAETLQVRNKLQLLTKKYDPKAALDELQTVADVVAKQHNIKLKDQPKHLDYHYFANYQPQTDVIDLTKQQKISGTCLGMIGGILIVQQDDQQFALSLSKLKGYKVNFCDDIKKNEHEPVQASLF